MVGMKKLVAGFGLWGMVAICPVAFGQGKVGENIPGPFHPLVLNGELADRYHCPLSDFGSRPTVILLVRGTDVSDGWKANLGALNGFEGKLHDLGMRAMAVFIDDSFKEPLALSSIDKRRDLQDKLKSLLGTTKEDPFPNIPVCLDSGDLLGRYPIPQGAEASVLIVKGFRLVDRFDLNPGDATVEKMNEILKKAEAKLIDKKLVQPAKPRLKPRIDD
jgi:hypothetical protein